jgi:hypothetical protein
LLASRDKVDAFGNLGSYGVGLISGDGERSQDANDGNDDHKLDQCEASVPVHFGVPCSSTFLAPEFAQFSLFGLASAVSEGNQHSSRLYSALSTPGKKSPGKISGAFSLTRHTSSQAVDLLAVA